MTLARIFSIQAAIVLGTGLFLGTLVGVLGPERRPSELLFWCLLLSVPAALIAIASRFDRVRHRKLIVVACTGGWILIGWFAVLLVWVNTYGS